MSSLLQFSNRVVNALSDRRSIDVVYFDFAFDRVDHSILLRKLNGLGVGGNVLRWVRSYLSDRFSAVNLKGTISSLFHTSSGVPQGSNLGPLLFLIFINDLPSAIVNSFIDLYADDVRMYRVVGSSADGALLQSDIDRLVAWASLNRFGLNVSKYQVLTISKSPVSQQNTYTINGTSIPLVRTARDLGVIIDSEWSFDAHLQKLAGICYALIGLIKRMTTWFRSIGTLSYLFKSLVLPNLNYASVIWTPHTAARTDVLNGIVKRFLRFASSRTPSPMHYTDHDYGQISELGGIYTIYSWHSYYDLMCAASLVDDSSMGVFTTRDIPYGLRAQRRAVETNSSSNLEFYPPTCRLRRSWNLFIDSLRPVLRDKFVKGTIDNGIITDSLRTVIRNYSLAHFV